MKQEVGEMAETGRFESELEDDYYNLDFCSIKVN